MICGEPEERRTPSPRCCYTIDASHAVQARLFPFPPENSGIAHKWRIKILFVSNDKNFPHIGKPCSEKFAVFFSCFLIISQRSEEIYERSYRVARAFFLLEFSPHSCVIGYSKETVFLIISPRGIYSFCIYILCQELNQ